MLEGTGQFSAAVYIESHSFRVPAVPGDEKLEVDVPATAQVPLGGARPEVLPGHVAELSSPGHNCSSVAWAMGMGACVHVMWTL